MTTDNKYEILIDSSIIHIEEIKKIDGLLVGLYEILFTVKALKDFGDVKAGDIGGLVASYDCLSQSGECWVYDNAKAFKGSRILDNAKLKDRAVIGDKVILKDNVVVSGNMQLTGDLVLHGTLNY